jgi:predicted CopG family antitoxin
MSRQRTQKSKSIRKKTGNSIGSKSPGLNHSFSNVIKDLFKDNKKQRIQAAALKHRRDSHSNNSDKKSKDKSDSASSSKIFAVVK